VLIGPSGCGKSTLLRILIKLIDPDSGMVTINGKILTSDNVESVRREVGYMVQDGGLFPHLTGRQNVLLLAKYLGMATGDNNRRLKELADLVQVPLTLLDRYPSALSGGQRQRVSLMRALMLDPNVLLLDEPMGALDPVTRSDLQMALKEIFSHLKKTVILVTHDMDEAAYLSDEVIMMRSGSIVQHGTLEELIKSPASEFVTQFIRAQRSMLPPLSEDA